MTGLRFETFLKRLWILGIIKYNFPKLVASLYSKEKYFSYFSEITPFLLRFLNMVILFSKRSGRIFSLNLTSWYTFLSLVVFPHPLNNLICPNSQTTTQNIYIYRCIVFYSFINRLKKCSYKSLHIQVSETKMIKHANTWE